jgi:hypothetical protein
VGLREAVSRGLDQTWPKNGASAPQLKHASKVGYTANGPLLSISICNGGFDMSKEAKRDWKQRLLEELRTLSITVIYLWALFGVLILHRAMVLSDYHIDAPQKLGFALVNALIIAKFMLIAEAFHAGERTAARKPLWYSILFKSAFFSVILVVCHIVEEALVQMWHGKSTAEILDRMTVSEIPSLGIIMFVILIPFFATKEIIRVLGKDEFKSLMLSRQSNIGTLQTKE